VLKYFHVTESKANKAIHQKLLKAVSKWESLAQQAGIRKEERELLRDCFILA
jgi:serine/threonine-protein kinase HipA